MKKNLLILSAWLILPSVLGLARRSGVYAQQRENITIQMNKRGAHIAPSMYGIFFEEINHAGDGGLYAEMVQNRSFEEKVMPEGYHAENDKLFPSKVKYHLDGKVRDRSYRWTTEDVPAWSLDAKGGKAQMVVTQENPKFASAPHNLKVAIEDTKNEVLLSNAGYWGMNIEKGENYLCRSIIRPMKSYKGKVRVRLVSDSGKELASTLLKVKANGKWQDLKYTLSAKDACKKAKLVISFDAPGVVYLDYVSLFPQHTFQNCPNGMRKDVAEMLAGLKPAFVRWPGGCVVEGITLNNRFEWKKTLGDPAARPGEYSTWGYRCSYGMGYDEILQYCEDIDAKAMFVCNVGLACQYRMGEASSEDSIAYYLDDCMDAIEYALGDDKTEWGAKRIANGHPAPYPLQYIEIGNENWGPVYEHRFNIFYKAIKEKYPQLTLIYNDMPEREGPMPIAKTDMIDPHYYRDPYWFFCNSDLYDNWERGKYHIYVGEYACNRSVGGGNMLGALSEAAFYQRYGTQWRFGDVLFENINIVDEKGRQLGMSGSQLLLDKQAQSWLDGNFDGNYTITFRAKKLDGSQGFQLYLGMTDGGKTGCRYTFGMWGGDRTEMLRLNNDKEQGVSFRACL